MQEKEKSKLKPVIFVQGQRQYYGKNTHVQNIILKALSEGVTDVNELRKMAGVKKAADVFRTLDKISLRKEYHQALVKAGITLDTIAEGINNICTTSSDSNRLKGYQLLLKSIGLEKYEKDEAGSKNWEDAILEVSSKEFKQVGSGKLDKREDAKSYKVTAPKTPPEEKVKIAEEKKLADELYGE